MTEQRTWEISDLDGSNRRTVTAEQYRAEVDAAKAKAMATFRANVRAAGLTLPAFFAE